MTHTLETAFSLLTEIQEEVHAVSRAIHANPELALQEFSAAKLQKELLRKHGFDIEENIASLPTAFRAGRVSGNGQGIHFAFFSEYDALKNIGHACGHNLICAAALAAGCISAKLLEIHAVSGRLSVFGSPGEELVGGKVIMADAGAFREVDAALICHPYDITSTDDGAYAVRRYLVRFHGHASHAGMAPEEGINALDAMILFFNGIALWRQQMPEKSRIHGIITNGGEAPNIIPAETEAFFYLRAPESSMLRTMEARFRGIVSGAAFQTGCTFSCDLVSGTESCFINPPLNEAYANLWEETGDSIRRANGSEGRASTDFGNVSQLMPGANLHFGICRKRGTPLHTSAFRDAAGTDFAFSQAMKCAAVMSVICLRYFTDENFRTQVLNAYRETAKNGVWTPGSGKKF